MLHYCILHFYLLFSLILWSCINTVDIYLQLYHFLQKIIAVFRQFIKYQTKTIYESVWIRDSWRWQLECFMSVNLLCFCQLVNSIWFKKNYAGNRMRSKTNRKNGLLSFRSFYDWNCGVDRSWLLGLQFFKWIVLSGSNFWLPIIQYGILQNFHSAFQINFICSLLCFVCVYACSWRCIWCLPWKMHIFYDEFSILLAFGINSCFNQQKNK